MTRVSILASPPDQLAWLARLSVHWVLASLPLGIAVAVLEHYSPGPEPSWRGYAIAILMGAGAGALVLALHGKVRRSRDQQHGRRLRHGTARRVPLRDVAAGILGLGGCLAARFEPGQRRAAAALRCRPAAAPAKRAPSCRGAAGCAACAVRAGVRSVDAERDRATLHDGSRSRGPGAGGVDPVPAPRDAGVAPSEFDNRPRMPPPRGVHAHDRCGDRRRGRNPHRSRPARRGHAGASRNLVRACAATPARDAPRCRLGPSPAEGSRRQARAARERRTSGRAPRSRSLPTGRGGLHCACSPDEEEPAHEGSQGLDQRRAAAGGFRSNHLEDRIDRRAGAGCGHDATPERSGSFFENEQTRVLEFVSRPGTALCGVGKHSHPAHLTIALSDAKVRVTPPDGSTIEATNKLGDVFWSEAETHAVENIGWRERACAHRRVQAARQDAGVGASLRAVGPP
ncbi:MAG: hypothetical protein MZV70_42945 [Desulfobacterales bacterium]|nr:hypothetical protein [Desulfobacterales bacterium]